MKLVVFCLALFVLSTFVMSKPAPEPKPKPQWGWNNGYYGGGGNQWGGNYGGGYQQPVVETETITETFVVGGKKK